jgi:hypothetical protein
MPFIPLIPKQGLSGLRILSPSPAATCPSSPLRHTVRLRRLPFFLAAPRRSAAAACHAERTPATIDLVGEMLEGFFLVVDLL